MPDNVEIIERVQTGFISGVHRTWIEFVVTTASSGEIAVFTPSRQELEQGEGELAVEHLRREATAFSDSIVVTRNGFRTARAGREVMRFWEPIMEHVHIEGELIASKPSLERIVLIIALGATLGIAGLGLSDPWSAWSSPLSAAVIGYALLGLAMTSYTDRDFGRGAGLQVPIRLGRPTALDESRQTVFSGPYEAIPQIGIDRTGDELELIPYVEIVDGEGHTVRLMTPEELATSHDPNEAAAILLRQADMFIDELEHNETEARRLAAGD